MMTVYCVLPPSVLLTDVAGPLDALRFATRFGVNLEVQVVSNVPQVASTCGIQLSGLKPLPDVLAEGDVLLIPGAVDEALAYQSAAGKALAQWLRRVFDPAQHQIITVCSGVFLLGAAGLLTGVKCTTHHNLLDDLRMQHPSAQVEANRVFVDDGAILTSAGVTAGFDVILYWLAQRFGTEVSLQVARHMNVYFRRTGNDTALSPWLIARSHMHPAVHRVQDAIALGLHNPSDEVQDLNALADIACVSSRHLTRIFKQHTGMTVHAYQLALRHAVFEQWRAQGLSQEKSAIAAGFSSANAWRRSRSNAQAE